MRVVGDVSRQHWVAASPGARTTPAPVDNSVNITSADVIQAWNELHGCYWRVRDSPLQGPRSQFTKAAMRPKIDPLYADVNAEVRWRLLICRRWRPKDDVSASRTRARRTITCRRWPECCWLTCSCCQWRVGRLAWRCSSPARPRHSLRKQCTRI